MHRIMVIFIILSAGILVLSACSDAANSAVIQEGDFSLVLESEKDEYEADEPIKLRAIFTYLGPTKELTIYHAMDFIYFQIEQLDGDFILQPVTPLPLKSTTLIQGEPVVRDYVKSGAFDETIRDKAFWEKFFAGPDLVLEPGTYKITATASFSTDADDMMGTEISIPASITIKVIE